MELRRLAAGGQRPAGGVGVQVPQAKLPPYVSPPTKTKQRGQRCAAEISSIPALAHQCLYLSIMISVDLMIALTVSPSFWPRLSAEPRVITDTISTLPTTTTTSAMIPSIFTDFTVPLS